LILEQAGGLHWSPKIRDCGWSVTGRGHTKPWKIASRPGGCRRCGNAHHGRNV